MIKRILALSLLTALSLMGPAFAEPASIKIDQQAYASNLVIDPHRSDQLSIHVSSAAGTPTAQAYLHLDFTSLPVGATLSGVTLKLVPNGLQQDNAGTPELGACVLAEPLKSDFDPAADPRPAYDCARAQVLGLLVQDGSWSFAIDPLVAQWQQFGNTGLAVVPITPPSVAGPAAPISPSSWQVGFLKTASAVTGNVLPPTNESASRGTETQTSTVSSSPIVISPGLVVSPLTSPPLPDEPGIDSSPIPTGQPQAITQVALLLSIRWLLVAVGSVAAIAGMLLLGGAQRALSSSNHRLSKLRLGLSATYSARAEVIGILILVSLVAAGLVGRTVTQVLEVSP